MTPEQHAVWFHTYQTVLLRVLTTTTTHAEAIQQAVDAGNAAVGLYPTGTETSEPAKRAPGRPKKEK